MFVRRLLVAAWLALFPSLATAAEAQAAGQAGRYLDLMPVGLPIVAKGTLVNYVFVSVRINLTQTADPVRLRAQEPVFRDALVRAGHRTPFTVPADYTRIDAARLSATFVRDAATIAGPGQIRSVVVTAQSPRYQLRAPRV